MEAPGCEKLKIKEAVVVEGRYDGHAVRACADTLVLELSGFSAFKNKRLIAALNTLAQNCGLIVLTDSDGAGMTLRNLIRGSVTGDVRHAYIPKIPGREKRKKKPGKAGLLGVEAMELKVIRGALLSAGATVLGDRAGASPSLKPVTRQELFDDGLLGGTGSQGLRRELCNFFGVPELSVSALCEFLSRSVGLLEYKRALEIIKTNNPRGQEEN